MGYIDGSAERIATINKNAIENTMKDSTNLFKGSFGLFIKNVNIESESKIITPANIVKKSNEKWPSQ